MLLLLWTMDYGKCFIVLLFHGQGMRSRSIIGHFFVRVQTYLILRRFISIKSGLLLCWHHFT